ncbi:MAG: hypothetical protein RLZZ241_943 [Bacteroidota bacterium]|jgi:hypothetical protein
MSHLVLIKAKTHVLGGNLFNKRQLVGLFFILITGIFQLHAQGYWDHLKDRPATLDFESGESEYKTSGFILKLVHSSQTVSKLSPVGAPDFDFTPSERLQFRNADTLYHLGDLNFRYRLPKGPWIKESTAYHRKPIDALPVIEPILAGADLGATLSENLPFQIKRFYEADGADLILRFELTNTHSEPVEIGALGIPMIFNNILEGKTLDEAHAQNVFFDPYMGMDAGYLEVKRLNGSGPGLLVVPEENAPFENYRPLLDDPTRRSVVFEGFHEWMTCSKAYTEDQWMGVTQWNEPRAFEIQPGETRNISLRLALNSSIENTESKLSDLSIPVAIGVPGFVLPQDVNASLWLKYHEPVSKWEIHGDGLVAISEVGAPQPNGFQEIHLKGVIWGRSRIDIRYADGVLQTIHYKVIKPENEVVRDIGHFLTTEQWFSDTTDIFNRAPSVITYDIETRKHVSQDRRAWIAGIGDEGGSGSWLAAVMKQYVQPNAEEIDKLSQFMSKTLWGGLQYTQDSLKYGVRKSMFYYEPDSVPKGTYDPSIDYSTWAAWSKEHAESVGRSFNYPHVAAAHWVFYRLSRYYNGLVPASQWQTHLDRAWRTVIAMTELAPYYAQFGQMEGTVFGSILEDLRREGWTDAAEKLESAMRARAEHWRNLNYPFGSEMPWDSTGQEEVYFWSDFFGFDEKASITLNAILAYMPVIPHWAYNGNARRYWDFLYGGKLSRIERQIHHYGSGMNAIPVLSAFRKQPYRFHLLQTGYGGRLGAISNITEEGFGPAAFHSFPQTLAIDGISGDYGPGFFGYAINESAYVIQHPQLGWLGFGANITENSESLQFKLTTASSRQFYLCPEEFWIRLDAGTINSIEYFPDSHTIKLHLAPSNKYTPLASLRFNREVSYPGQTYNGAYKIPLKPKEETVLVLDLKL